MTVRLEPVAFTSGDLLSGKSSGNVEHEAVQAGPIWLHGFDDSSRNRAEFVSTKASRNQNDPCMLGVSRDRLVSKLDEVDHIRRNDSPAFSCCISKLSPIIQLNIANLVGRSRVYAMLSE